MCKSTLICTYKLNLILISFWSSVVRHLGPNDWYLFYLSLSFCLKHIFNGQSMRLKYLVMMMPTFILYIYSYQLSKILNKRDRSINLLECNSTPQLQWPALLILGRWYLFPFAISNELAPCTFIISSQFNSIYKSCTLTTVTRLSSWRGVGLNAKWYEAMGRINNWKPICKGGL